MGSIHSVVAKLPQGRNAADAERISSNYVPSEKDTLVSLLAAREPYSQEDLNMMQILLYNDDEPDERYWFYQEGFLHPVQLGDQLSDGRYTIINKLGNGSFSTVWLAHDEVLSRKVAIKIAYVWALGCIIVELYARYSVFQTYFPRFEEVWAEMVHVLGKPPQTWLEASKADIDSGNNDNGSNLDNETPRHRDPTSLSDHIVQLVDKDRSEKLVGIWEDADEDENVPAGELRDLLSMLEQIFCWLPEDGIKADDLMNGDWMKNWGLPAIEAMEKAYEEKAQVTKQTSASSGSGSASNTMHHGKTDSPVNETWLGVIRGLFKTARWGLGTGVWLWLGRALGI
ncbi:hypothetical protein COL26b_010886 [Colletotrichum chrysophilum]|uniref:uncharacterized protein n=1 Tax=Colletotrichum chrysophilum TaxID=1836956 RepID=UPI002301DC47|nr:uncharacterized protein COL26b_010886 [Colletotrichum chrysophilum]KAJ0344350.1 hypothetical protein KNSL1_009462 [Colletotrichum chrysophilum]KAJ0368467.1 hypothetical protein COL26b_010886 [Colletotrichum chrysophilum]